MKTLTCAIVTSIVGVMATASPMARSAAPLRVAEIRTSDVDTFYRLFDGAHGHPAAADLQRDYIDAGSESLHAFAIDRKITGDSLTAAIAKNPATFSGAQRCAATLPGVRARLLTAFARLRQLYPPARFPPVTVVIGRGATGGTTNANGVVIGLETLCAADYMDPDVESRFVHLIAHEYIHVQQPAAQTDPDHPTVLFASLVEGGAEFVGSLISGDVGNYQLKQWTKGHEPSIEQSFAKDIDSESLSPWLWAGPGTAEHPGDLGYWVGYRIVKAYYFRARDKRRALREIIEMKDPKAFLAASGWKPARAPSGR